MICITYNISYINYHIKNFMFHTYSVHCMSYIFYPNKQTKTKPGTYQNPKSTPIPFQDIFKLTGYSFVTWFRTF